MNFFLLQSFEEWYLFILSVSNIHSRLIQLFELQIPINGSFDRPQVDWAAAGRGITQLALQRNVGGSLLSAVLEQFDLSADAAEVPQPIGNLPWATD